VDHVTGALIAGWFAVAGVLLALLGRTRLRRTVLVVALIAAGAGIGLGGILIEGESGPVQAIAATVVLGLLAPLHVRVLLGPLGRRE
jgi:hypothetical protein